MIKGTNIMVRRRCRDYRTLTNGVKLFKGWYQFLSLFHSRSLSLSHSHMHTRAHAHTHTHTLIRVCTDTLFAEQTFG